MPQFLIVTKLVPALLAGCTVVLKPAAESPLDALLLGEMIDEIEIQCPYCCERVTITIEPDTWGKLVQDCEVCCNSWELTITRDRDGDADVRVEKAQE